MPSLIDLTFSIETVVKVGKAHGALRPDIYGCLYFYLSEQLRTFAERLNRFRIKFSVFCKDASGLSSEIKSGALTSHGIPATIRFDRIEVSNILDAEYVGILNTLTDWGPLLRESRHATILGYSMNWPARQTGADVSTADAGVLKRLLGRLEAQGRVRLISRLVSSHELYLILPHSNRYNHYQVQTL